MTNNSILEWISLHGYHGVTTLLCSQPTVVSVACNDMKAETETGGMFTEIYEVS